MATFVRLKYVKIAGDLWVNPEAVALLREVMPYGTYVKLRGLNECEQPVEGTPEQVARILMQEPEDA